MSKTASIWVTIAALAAVAEAHNAFLPRATGTFVYPSDGMSPWPTHAPQVQQGLLRRADDSSTSPITVLIAPDNTCGYISGLQGAGYTCFSTDLCVFYTAEAQYTGSVGCCNTDACYVRRSCVDYEGYFSSSQCTGGCQFDAFTLKCTNGAARYCNTISFGDDIIDYWCNSDYNTTPQGALTTYKGQEDRSFSEFPLTSTSYVTSATDNDDGPTATDDPISETSSSATASKTDASASSSSDESGNGDSKDKDDNDDGTPIGPIVGGVVGGVGGIGLIGAAIWFFRRHNKKKQLAEQQQDTQQTSPMQQYGAPPAGYNPNTQSYYGGPPPQGTQPYSPHQQYPQSPPAGGYYPGGVSPHTSPDPHVAASSPSSQMTDPRMSQPTGSPGSAQGGPYAGGGAFQPQQNTIHEAPANARDSHRGDTHELA